MDIKLKEVFIRELVNEYKDSNDDGVIGYYGKLDIRPPYQREFVYDVKERNAVLNTLKKGLSTKCDVLGSSQRWKL